jgi:hypothetical protein
MATEIEKGHGKIHNVNPDENEWIDRWWPLFLVAFGIACIIFVGCYKKYW